MEKKDVVFFVKKIVTLKKIDGFLLRGTIIKLNEDSIVFETDQATSLIDFDNIKEIILKKDDNNERR